LLLGCLILTFKDEGVVKIRQMAVETQIQGRGLGKLMMQYSEKVALQRGYREMQLSVRENAILFYLSQGYEIYGEPLIEVTIPHRLMKKTLL